jgi:ribonuclease E
MAKRMLIDATHPEETRVVVISGNRLDEFDFESSTKKQLKGNIYLAKVVRVEPSLQAAFVDYAGNRHGFLAFNEIHPDYYRIPIADRQALIKEDASLAKQSAADEGDEAGGLEIVGGDEAEEVERRRPKVLRSYKIQEVIKRRQILLVQVVKEERGNKGAALTTYLSLAGRYCVLMPNTARGGGISRKITNPKDRKRLKAIVEELKIPDELAVIVRTAGSERTKAEIKRDYEYLNRLWDEIRELTLKSTAPALIYEEANIIKRAVRDLYTKEIDEILVDGDEGYKTAKAFMKMMIPSHARKVKPADDPAIPLFHRYQVESQLDAIHNPTVQLRSGGYIVLNPTEALVSIDVNSGRATRERHIEETALKTNIEAAEEIARQLRLRDLAGLIVIDFIDMEETKNIVAVERRLKEAMRHDRARIQIGRISPFGLLELSRQRLRPSLVEASTLPCRHCGGTGHVRSTESTALHILRAIEEEGIRGRSAEITAYVPTAVALYVLNQKRERLGEIEGRYRFRVFVASDDELIPPDFRIERVKAEAEAEAAEAAEEVAEAPPAREAEEERPAAAAEEAEAEETRRRRKARRRRPKREEVAQAVPVEAEAEAEGVPEAPAEAEPMAAGEEDKKRRRRGKRGGRRRTRREELPGAEAEVGEETPLAAGEPGLEAPGAEPAPGETEPMTEPMTEPAAGALDLAAAVAEPAPFGETEPVTEPAAGAPDLAAVVEAAAPEPAPVGAAEPVTEPAAKPTPAPRRRRKRKVEAAPVPPVAAEAPEVSELAAAPAGAPEAAAEPALEEATGAPPADRGNGAESAAAAEPAADHLMSPRPAPAVPEPPFMVAMPGSPEAEAAEVSPGAEQDEVAEGSAQPRRRGWLRIEPLDGRSADAARARRSRLSPPRSRRSGAAPPRPCRPYCRRRRNGRRRGRVPGRSRCRGWSRRRSRAASGGRSPRCRSTGGARRHRCRRRRRPAPAGRTRPSAAAPTAAPGWPRNGPRSPPARRGSRRPRRRPIATGSAARCTGSAPGTRPPAAGPPAPPSSRAASRSSRSIWRSC